MESLSLKFFVEKQIVWELLHDMTNYSAHKLLALTNYCGLVWSKGTKFKGIVKIISTYILRGGEERLRDTYIM